MNGPRICVIIPAFNAEATIGTAVHSALAQDEVAEVVVIDDASQDATSERARAAAAGDPRLRVLRQDRNIGPSRARNIAIDASSAPLIALLDADDFFLPGRFAALLAQSGWDLIADNIVFVPEGTMDPEAGSALEQPARANVTSLSVTDFLNGNIPDRRTRRGELGFLKPLISREFLERNGLRYDTGMRLGEDFKLYVEMLALGARFQVMSRIGYVAQVRPESLSGRHRAEDLHALLRASLELRGIAGVTLDSRRAMRDYLYALQARYLLHAFLELKAEQGLLRAARLAFLPPKNLFPIARGVLRDKLASLFSSDRQELAARRYLMPIDEG